MLRSITLGVLAFALLMSASPSRSARQALQPGVWEGAGPTDVVVAAPASCAVTASIAPANLGPID